MRSFTDRLRKAGKPHKVIITAVARKLVTIANALCKSVSEMGGPVDLIDTVARTSSVRMVWT